MKTLRLVLYLICGLLVAASVLSLLFYLSLGAPQGSAPWYQPSWAVLTQELQSLSAGAQLAIALLIAFAGIIFGWLFSLIAEIRPSEGRNRGITHERYFPFTIYSTSDIEPVKKRFLKEYASLEYQPRFDSWRQRTFESNLDVPLLMLTGRTGLGKTRECIELFLRLSKQKGEEFTILYPKDDFDRPSEHDVPPEFSPRNLILFIDDIHLLCRSPEHKMSDGEQPIRSFHERLASTIQWMKERYAGKDIRVVLTCCDEPDLRAKARLDAEVWSDFLVKQLPGIHKTVREAFIHAVGKHYGLTIDSGAAQYIARESDGTSAGIINVLAGEESERPGIERLLRRSDVEKYTFRYPKDWESKVYQPYILPHTRRRAVFETLSACQQLGIPTLDFFVTELAAHILLEKWPRWSRPLYLWRAKSRIRQTIRHDLCAWMFEYLGEIICPSAYTEDRVSISAVIPKLTSAMLRVVKEERLFSLLKPRIAPLSLKLTFDFGFSQEALAILRRCEDHGLNARMLIAKCEVLAEMHRHSESLEAAKAACQADPGSATALVVLSCAYSRLKQVDLAVETARKATQMAPSDDYTWLSLGVLLCKSGLHTEAITCLETARDLSPKSAKAWYSLGIAYERAGHSQQSIDACQHATVLDPGDSEAWHVLGIACDRAGRIEDAIAALRRATALDPDNVAALFSLSRSLSSGGQRHSEEARQAREQFKKLAKSANDWQNVSIVYGKAKEFETAVAASRRALEIDPTYLAAARSLVVYLSKFPERVEEALQARERFKKLAKSAEDWFEISQDYDMARERSEALAAAREALKIDPTHVGAARRIMMRLAKLPEQEDEVREARERFKNLAKSADDWVNLSIAYGRAGEFKEAVAAAQKAFEIDPTDVKATARLVEYLSKFPKRREEARQARERFKNLAKSANEWFELSQAYSWAREPAEAVAAARKALEITPKHFKAAFSLAVSLSKLPERAEEARQARDRIKDLARSAYDWFEVSRVYFWAGELAEAIAAARKALEVNPTFEKAASGLVKYLSKLPEREGEADQAGEELGKVNSTGPGDQVPSRQ